MISLKDYLFEARAPKEEKRIYWRLDVKNSGSEDEAKVDYKDLMKDKKFLDECDDCFVILHLYESKRGIGRINNYYSTTNHVRVYFDDYAQPWTDKRKAQVTVKQCWAKTSFTYDSGHTSIKNKIVIAKVSEVFDIEKLQGILSKNKFSNDKYLINVYNIRLKTTRGMYKRSIW